MDLVGLGTAIAAGAGLLLAVGNALSGKRPDAPAREALPPPPPPQPSAPGFVGLAEYEALRREVERQRDRLDAIEAQRREEAEARAEYHADVKAKLAVLMDRLRVRKEERPRADREST